MDKNLKSRLFILEIKIDRELKGRNSQSEDLSEGLKKLIGKYNYEVECYNLIHEGDTYPNISRKIFPTSSN